MDLNYNALGFGFCTEIVVGKKMFQFVTWTGRILMNLVFAIQ